MNQILIVILLAMSVSFSALAEEPAKEQIEQVEMEVHKRLVRPLNRESRKLAKFGRGAPVIRRVRFVKVQPEENALGKSFWRFAVDRRYAGESEWLTDEVVGCIYGETKEIFVVNSRRLSKNLLNEQVSMASAGACEKKIGLR